MSDDQVTLTIGQRIKLYRERAGKTRPGDCGGW